MQFFTFWTLLVFFSETECGFGQSLVQKIIKDYDYPIETFSDIITEDRYLLTMYRIPRGRNSATKLTALNHPPVLLMHGLLGSSYDYVVMGPERGLAFLLADQGYDVWLGNARGTIHSTKHLRLNPKRDPRYWEFSWHEIGVYDLPAMFSTISNITGASSLSYVGISQGTTVFYVMASVRPEYNQKVNLMVSLAPVAYMSHLRSPFIRALAALEPFLAKLTGVNQLLPEPLRDLVVLWAKTFCPLKEFQDSCASFLWIAGGYDPHLLNKSALPEIYGEGPSSSLQQPLHYAQNINSGLFRQYSYGWEMNLAKYGSAEPPSYNLRSVVAPVALFHSENDWFAQPADVDRLSKELPKVVYQYLVPFKAFNHFDFLYASNVVALVYERAFRLLNEYNNYCN